MGTRLDITGIRFGSLVAIDHAGVIGIATLWRCRCDCGSIGKYRLGGLRGGRTTKCPECRGLHGKSSTPEYAAWQAAKQTYDVVKAWSTFAGFLKDMPRRPVGMNLRPKSRKRLLGPNNHEWVTKSQVIRDIATERDGITFNGRRLTMADWGRELGISRERVRVRLKTHPIEIALGGARSTRKRGKGRRKPDGLPQSQ
jgi:hypothetical protein